MEEIKENNSKNIIIILLSILSIILVIYIVYSLTTNKDKSKEKDPINEKPKIEEGIYKEIKKEDLKNVNSKLTESYLDSTIKAFDSPLANRSRDLNLDLYGYYYRRNSVEIDKISNIALVYVGLYDFALKTYARTDIIAGKQMCVSRDTVHNTVKNKYRDITFKDLGPNDELMVYGDIYKFKIDEYCAFIGGGRGGPLESIENVIVGYKEYSDKIEVFTKVLFIYYKNGEAMGHIPIVTQLFKDIDRSILVSESEDTFDIKNIKKEELDKFSTYKFTYNIKGDNLEFYSVEKTNE